jgi:DNA-binding protein HU-beta
MATVSKSDLVSKLAQESGLDNTQSKAAIEKTFEIIASSLAAGDEVNLPGFGKFSTVERSARQGKNPSTGETIQIAASTAPKFSAASALKAAVKN